MKLVDPERSWLELERRMATETDLRCKAVLEQVRNHMRAELRMQLEPLMATLIHDPEYHFHGMPGFESLNGRDAVICYYERMFAEGRMGAEFEVDRIVVDHNAVVTEGYMIAIVGADALLKADVYQVGGIKVDVALTYLSRARLLVVWPVAADGRLIGEEIYLGTTRYENIPERRMANTKIGEGD